MQPRQPIIKCAFIGAVLLYIGIAHYIAAPPHQPGQDVAFLAKILTGVYMLTALVAPLILSRFPRESNQRMLIALALYESGAIFGLMLSFMSYNPQYAIYFGGTSALLMLLLA